MRQLRPMIVKDRYWSAIRAEIQRVLNDLIYKPLGEVLREEIVNAAGGALLTAIRQGQVWIEDGSLKGEFTAAITRELRRLGAVYDMRRKSWHLIEIPTDLKIAQAEADSRYDVLRHAVLSTLADIDIESISQRTKTKGSYEQTIEWMDGDFQKAVAGIAIPPKLTDDQRNILARDYSQNLDLYIKDWAAENITALREQVQADAFAGGRGDSIVKLLQHNYGVSQRKAEFLARQETALLMSKFQETRYADIGVRRYRWSGANDARERPDHRELNNKIFSFDDPPVTDRRTGARNNPGQDFNCRCVAVPIIE